MNLVSPLERQPLHRTDSRLSEDRRLPVRLSWDSSSCVPHLRHVLLCVHSPATLLPPFGPSLQSAGLVPPSWFRTTPTVYSAHRPRVYCTPKPDGVRGVSRLCPTYCRPKPTTDGGQSPFPARAVHTLRRIPLASSRTASLRPLPPCRFCRVATVPNTEALDSTLSARQQASPPPHLSQPKPLERVRRAVRVSCTRSPESRPCFAFARFILDSHTRNAFTLTDPSHSPKRSGQVHCTVFACSPEGALAGRLTRRRSV